MKSYNKTHALQIHLWNNPKQSLGEGRRMDDKLVWVCFKSRSCINWRQNKSKTCKASIILCFVFVPNMFPSSSQWVPIRFPICSPCFQCVPQGCSQCQKWSQVYLWVSKSIRNLVTNLLLPISNFSFVSSFPFLSFPCLFYFLLFFL